MKKIIMFLLIIISVILSAVILLQNPKGQANVLTVAAGAKQGENILVRSTWVLGIALFLVALESF